MTQASWMIDETAAIDDRTARTMDRWLSADPEVVLKGTAEDAPALAVRLQEMVIHDNKKWFGEAEVRLDALIFHGAGQQDDPQSFYTPQTFHFQRIGDGSRLPIDEAGGLLFFYGKPLYFLDIFLMVSRNKQDSDDLSELLTTQLQNPEVQAAMTTLLGLAVAAPQVALIVAAIGATAVIGNFAYQALQQATGDTIGLYRTSWLQHRDDFGKGQHPEEGGLYSINDLSFRYEIVEDVA